MPTGSVIDGHIGTTLAEMAFGCPPVVTRALYDVVERSELGYLSPAHVRRLGEATAEWLWREHGWTVPVEAIRPVADLVAGFRAVLTHFVPAGEPVIVPTPGYMPFLSMPPTIDRPVIEVAMRYDGREWRYDLDGIRAAFAAGARMLVLCNPHNPIGKVATDTELAEIEAIVAEADGMVFADEIHAPIIFGGRRHLVYANRSARAAAHTITATSATKAFNIPGLKCGQLVFGNPEHLQRWRAVGRWHEHQTSSLGVIATEAAYAAGRPWLDEVVDYVEGTIAGAVEVLADSATVACRAPEATYLLWIDLRATSIRPRGGTGVAQTLSERARLTVTDGAECGAAGAGFVRFNAALPRPHVREAMRRFVAVAGDAERTR